MMMKENVILTFEFVVRIYGKFLFLGRVLLPWFPQKIYSNFKIGIKFAKNMIHNICKLHILRIRTNYLLYTNPPLQMYFRQRYVQITEFSDDEI